MTDYYMKAADESTMWAALEAAVLVNEERQPIGISLDVIGTIYKQVGTDADGAPIMTAIPGYHANIRGELTQEQLDALPLVQAPSTPYRVWA